MNLLARGVAILWLCIPGLLPVPASAQSTNSTGIRLLDKRSLPASWLGFNGQNVTTGAVSWVDPNLVAKVPELKPKLLRYPSGFSFWDWKEGWFVDSPLLPEKYASWERKPNYLENFKIVLDSSEADAIFTLNMVTATLQDQVAMLQHADSIGIPVKYVELGSEFYFAPAEESGEGLEVIDSVYPTARSYGVVANEWIDTIHHYFPEAKVCVIGAWAAKGNGKKGTWNDSLRAVLSGREDAWSYHVYQPSGWYDSTETEEDLLTPDTSEVAAWMAQSFVAFDILQISEGKANPAKESWITEYNLNDHARPVQGLWGHGLFNSTLSLLYLTDTRITHAVCHAMVGSALYGQFFTDSAGFFLSPYDDSFPTLPDPPASSPWSLTATGHTMSTVSEAQLGMTDYCLLDFPKAPLITVVGGYEPDTVIYPGIIGALFSNASGSKIIMLNLTKNDLTISSGKMLQGGTYIMKSAGPDSTIANELDVRVDTGTMESSLVLKAYSITKITSNLVPDAGPSIQIVASASTELCEGDSVQLDAGKGYTSYLWSTGERTRFIWAKSGGEYVVRVTGNLLAYAGSDTIHVTVHPAPEKPIVTKSGGTEFCADKTAELNLVTELNEGSTFVWSTGAVADSLLITSSGTYYGTLTDQYGCSARSDEYTFTVNPLPVASISASGALTFCDGGSVVLTAQPDGMNYVWSSGQTTQSITVDKTATRSVVVTDAKGCKSTSETVSITEIVPPNPTITVTGPLTYCSGATPTYLSTISGYSYQWKKGSASISGATQQTYTPVSSGTYKVTITDASGCTRTTTSGKTVTINAAPTPSITASLTNICNSQTSTLTVNSVSGWTYQWLKNGSKISGATGTTYTASIAATYNCKATITATGCTATSNSVVISSNCRTEEEETESLPHLVLFPNPAGDQVTIRAHGIAEVESPAYLELRNVLGQLVMRQEVELTEGISEIEVNFGKEVIPGLYTLTVFAATATLTEQLVVR